MPEQTIGLQAVQRKALRRTRSRIGMPIVGLSTGDDAISVRNSAIESVRLRQSVQLASFKSNSTRQVFYADTVN